MAGEAGRGKGKTEEYIVYFLALGGGGKRTSGVSP